MAVVSGDAPPQSTPPTTPTQPTGDAAGYSCTATQNWNRFVDDANAGKFRNSNPGASAAPYNALFQRLVEAAEEEKRLGTCNPNSTTPNPAYSKDSAAIDALADMSRKGIAIKHNPDGSWDLSDPDTMAAAVAVGKETVRQNDADANKDKPPDESKSGSGSGGGSGGGSGEGSMPAGTGGGSGGGSGGSMPAGTGGGSGGGGTPTEPQKPAETDAEKEAAKMQCQTKIQELNAAIGNAYVALSPDAQQIATPVMQGITAINASASDVCTKASQLQDVLNKVVAAGQTVAAGGQGGAVQTTTVNPMTGVKTTQTAWYDPATGDCWGQTDTVSSTGATSSVQTKTTPAGQTTAKNIPAGGNPNTTVNTATGKTTSGLTPANTGSGANTSSNWGNLLFWGAVGIVGVSILGGGGSSGGKKK